MSVRIINGDMRDVVRDIPDSSIDCVFADPPYGETSLAWDRWVLDWPNLVRRVLKPSGSMWVFGSARMFLDHAAEFSAWRLSQDVVWEKHNGTGIHNDRFRRVHECAYHFWRREEPWAHVWRDPQFTNDAIARAIRRKEKPQHYNPVAPSAYRSEDGGPRLMRSVIYARSDHGRAEHPTQKPVAIVEPLLLYACPPGGTVLDPFAGSGTTGVAAARHGRNAILIEAEAEYCAVAERRLRDDAPLFQAAAQVPA